MKSMRTYTQSNDPFFSIIKTPNKCKCFPTSAMQHFYTSNKKIDK